MPKKGKRDSSMQHLFGFKPLNAVVLDSLFVLYLFIFFYIYLASYHFETNKKDLLNLSECSDTIEFLFSGITCEEGNYSASSLNINWESLPCRCNWSPYACQPLCIHPLFFCIIAVFCKPTSSLPMCPNKFRSKALWTILMERICDLL